MGMPANETIVHASNTLGQKLIRLALMDASAPDALQLLCKTLELPSVCVVVKSKQIKNDCFLITCKGSGYMLNGTGSQLEQISIPELLPQTSPLLKDFPNPGSNYVLVAPGETMHHSFTLMLGFESESAVFSEADLGLVLTFVEEKIKKWWQNEKDVQIQRSHFFEALLGQLPADIAVFDRNCRYLYLNKSAIRNDEIREWLIGKDDFDYCKLRNRPLDIAENRKEHIQRVIETGETISFEETILNSGKPYTHIRMLKPVFSETMPGQLEYVIGYGINISKQKEMEQKTILQSQVMDAAFEGIALLDASGQFTYLNKSMLNMFAYTQQELRGTGWQKLHSADEVTRITGTVFPLLEQNGCWNGEATGCDSMGNPVPIEITYTVLENGQMVCICRDIRQRKQQEEELKKLAIVARKCKASVIITDKSGKIEWVNEAFSSFSGYPSDDVKGLQPGQFLQGEGTNAQTIEEIDTCINKGEHFRGELLIYKSNGNPYWVDLDITPVYNQEGRIQQFIWVQNDITALKKAEDEIRNALNKERELNELKSRLISMASHEFRTPLTTIQMGTELMEKHIRKVAENGFIAEIANNIYRDIAHITNLLNEILLLGKIETNKYPFNPVPCNPQALINNYVNANKLLLQNRKVHVSTSGNNKEVYLDAKMFTHILDNIVGNAVKYSAESSSIGFEIKQHTGQVEITISDEGIGIPEDEIKHLFHSFYRGSNTESIPGTGLGLVIVKHFMDAHQGHIEISSQQNKGTSVTLTIPEYQNT